LKKITFMLGIILCSIIFLGPPVTAATLTTTINTSVPSLPPLDEKTALKQILVADNLVSHLKSLEAKTNEFAYNFNGRAYVFMAQEFSSKEKIINYLSQVYTKESASAYYDLAGYEVFKGRVIHFTGGIGNEYSWDEAIISLSLINDLPTSKKFNLILPINDYEYFERNIVFKFVPKIGWRIATLPDDTWKKGDLRVDTMPNDGWKTHQ
jgi:hypothetical protein